MANVIVGLTVSLDGFIAGPNDGPANPLGDGGDRLFSWMSAGPGRTGSISISARPTPAFR